MVRRDGEEDTLRSPDLLGEECHLTLERTTRVRVQLALAGAPGSEKRYRTAGIVGTIGTIGAIGRIVVRAAVDRLGEQFGPLPYRGPREKVVLYSDLIEAKHARDRSGNGHELERIHPVTVGPEALLVAQGVRELQRVGMTEPREFEANQVSNYSPQRLVTMLNDHGEKNAPRCV